MTESAFRYVRRLGRGQSAAALAVVALGAVACSAPSTSAEKGRPGSPAPSTSTPASATAGSPSAIAGGGASQRPAAIESNPPGDIPDNIAYVTYLNTAGRYSFVHPEGWASVVRGPAATFTDKLNGIAASRISAAAPPTVATAMSDVAKLRTTEPAFELRSVKPVRLPGGSGVLITFRRNSAPDPVTGKVFRDEVQRYEIYRGGAEVILDLYGAVGSDNVDPYTKVSQSLKLS